MVINTNISYKMINLTQGQHLELKKKKKDD